MRLTVMSALGRKQTLRELPPEGFDIVGTFQADNVAWALVSNKTDEDALQQSHIAMRRAESDS